MILPALALYATQISPRFETKAPLPYLPSVTMDALGNSFGIANQWSRSKHLQGRILWIDCTANIDRYNTEEKIVALVERVKRAGFNTIVFDIKPISGQVIYNSAYAPRIKEWRGRVLPENFEPVPIMVREAKKHGLLIYGALNAFSEGHRMFLVGPGYDRLDQQTVLYETENVLRFPRGGELPLAAKLNAFEANRLAVLDAASHLPKTGTAFVAALRPNGTVVDAYEWRAGGPDLTLPKDGTFVVAQGDLAPKLRTLLEPGHRLKFDTKPIFVPISQRPEQQYPLMMNPYDPRAEQYALNIVKEAADKFAFDGLIYDDRLRHGGMNADFSEITRGQFEKVVGKKLNWPNDVFQFSINGKLGKGIVPGPFYDRWMAFRAQRMTDFLRNVRRQIGTKQLGVYAGSWYGEYPSLGSNWASPSVQSGFWFADSRYRTTGFANDIDFFISGCYYPTATIHDAMSQGKPIGPTVEAAGMLTNRLVEDRTWSYAGLMLSQFNTEPDRLGDALQAAMGSTQGVMVFDLSHDIDQYWETFERAFKLPAKSPNAVPGLLQKLRAQRELLNKQGRKLPPVLMTEGSAGTGQ